MRVVYGGSNAGTTRVDGQLLRNAIPVAKNQRIQREDADRNVRPVSRIGSHRIHFRDLAQMAFPIKTEANLAFLARVDTRTARRWIADDSEPPADVLGIVLAEIMKRFHQRD